MYERILVPLDGSDVAEIALDHATAIARLNKSTLVLLRVVEPFDSSDVFPASEPGAEDAGPKFSFNSGRLEGDKQAADEYLANLKGKLAVEQLAVHCVTALGLPAEEILSYAAEFDGSLIVMSTHIHGGKASNRSESVAERVLTGSPVPLLLIPHR